MPLCVIFNPAAKGDHAREFRRKLDTVATDAVFKPTTGPGAARELAAEAVVEGYQKIVAVGGDGTINEVLNGIADAPEGLSRAALGIIPLGTANVFARELHLPFNPRAAWDILRAGRRTRVDLFRITHQLEGRTVSRLAVQLAGAGLDARAVELVDWNLKKRSGFLAYVVAGVKALRESQPQIRVDADGAVVAGELVLVGNGRFYGGPFAAFPGADLRDGLLDVRIFPRAGWGTALACAAGAVTHRMGRAGGSRNLKARRFTLTANRRVPLQLDGELAGELPATFEVLPTALEVIVP